ncbi:MAG: ribonuclease J [Candidatus Pacebacteria bacterium]|nr:ribonuclease J [Candidatus Paceibacterota bacterium]MBP9772860.1 ribonuclease J [Candidatus Paceibacterota bacterium]
MQKIQKPIQKKDAPHSSRDLKAPARHPAHIQAHGGSHTPHTHATHANTTSKDAKKPFTKGAPKRSGGYRYQKHGSRKNGIQSVTTHLPTNKPKQTNHIPPVGPGVVRIIPLGGVEEIGKNMTAIEIGNDIIVIDAGMQFKTDDTPGIDYIIPNTTYLEERKDKIRAMIITHGHLDHIGGVPIVMDRIGNPPIYSRNLSVLLMKKRQSEFPHLKPLDAHIVENESVITLGNIKVRFFGVTHTVPDSMGIIVETPYGWIVTPGDYKLEHQNGIPSDREEKEYSIFDEAKVLLLMTDSTNIENPDWAIPETEVHKGLESIIKSVKGRLIIAAFASHIERLIKVVEIAESLNKHIVLEGRSMKTNMEVSIQAGLLNPKKGTIISIEEVENYPPDRIIILSTGGQGEEFSALMRASNKTHKNFRLGKGDTIVLSASIVPGNELAVQKLKDNLARQGVRIIHYRTSEVSIHSTGHGNVPEIKWLHRKTHPKFFIPIHGNHYMLKLHKELAMSLGMPESNVIVPDNGSIIEINENGEKMVLRKEKAPSGNMMVDGFSVGDEQEVVIRDRRMLAEDGMFIVMVIVDGKTGKLKKSPDLISRGFVYLKENQELLRQARIIIKKTIEETTNGANPINFDYIKGAVTDEVSKFLFQKTAKRPLVIPVLLSM